LNLFLLTGGSSSEEYRREISILH